MHAYTYVAIHSGACSGLLMYSSQHCLCFAVITTISMQCVHYTHSRAFSGPYEGRGPNGRLADVLFVAFLASGYWAADLGTLDQVANGAFVSAHIAVCNSVSVQEVMFMQMFLCMLVCTVMPVVFCASTDVIMYCSVVLPRSTVYLINVSI
jgi:hypothetical protein